MDRLLSAVLEAHGGLDNWEETTCITAQMSLGGPFWEARGWPGVYADQTVTLDPHRQHITFTPFPHAGHVSVLDVEPERIRITDLNGKTIEERAHPRDSFPANFNEHTTRWDAIQLAYFTSAAVWNYLTAPFVFTLPGVEAHEIAPWTESTQIWRRLAVTFPTTLATHNAEQVFYFDREFMQRRMDYSPDVTGNPPIAQYAYDHKPFDGFVFPTQCRVHRHDANGAAHLQSAAITLSIAHIRVDR